MNILHINKINFDQTNLLHSSTRFSPVVLYSVRTINISFLLHHRYRKIHKQLQPVHMWVFTCIPTTSARDWFLKIGFFYVCSTGSDLIYVGVVVIYVVLACLLTVTVFNRWDIPSGGIYNDAEKAFFFKLMFNK